MDAGGQLAGLNFPNFTGFSGQVLNQGPDPVVNEVMIRAYNDWHVDEWCGAHPDRFIPCGILPLWDVDKAAAEVRRLADKGCHAVTFSENPRRCRCRRSTRSGTPFAAACDVGTVLCCHVGSASRPAPAPSDAPASVKMTTSSVMSILTLVELLWADFWVRFPDLRFSLTEGDIGWIPYFVWRAEHVQNRHSGWTKHTFPDDGGPRKIFEDHFLCCFISEDVGVRLLEDFNVDNVCWESDYPHSDSPWPNGPEVAAKAFADLPSDVVAKITHENAMRHYQFDPFATRAKERCTVGALRAESPDVDTVTHAGRPADDRDLEAWRKLTMGRQAAAAQS